MCRLPRAIGITLLLLSWHFAALAATNEATDPGGGGVALVNSGPVQVLSAPSGVNPLKSSVTASPSIVSANGTATSTITVTLRDQNNLPVAGKTVTLSSGRGAIDTMVQPAAATNASGVATGTISSTTPGVATITAVDTTDSITLAQQPAVSFTQGSVLDVQKSANKKQVVVGDVITYLVEIRNKTTKPVSSVFVEDQIPPDFKYIKGSARLNGAVLADPSGNRPLTFTIGTVPALVDTNGNGKADPGEQGYIALRYQMVVGSGAAPRDYVNTAFARDVCQQCAISNASDATVTVTLDPTFDLGTIIGKVFEDKNRNGWQDRDEPGVAGVMVALDDGTYAITDEYGRYHFPAVRPGQRLVKINLLSLSRGAVATTDEAVVVSVTPGLLAKANFGVLRTHDAETIGRPAQPGLALNGERRDKPFEVLGSAESMTLLVNGMPVSLSGGDITLVKEGLSEVVELKGETLEKPVEFLVETGDPDKVTAWKLTIFDAQGAVVRELKGVGAPPAAISWDGLNEAKRIVKGGEIYQYQLELQYAEGSRTTSARRLFGVNQTTAISLKLSGSAFVSGSDVLSAEAHQTLEKTAELLRKYPEEKVIIEGHADAQGSRTANLEISRKRAEAVRAYLVDVAKIPAERFTVRWYGSSRPVASNASSEGRTLNRRVEIKGEVREVDRAELLDEYRTEPTVTINGNQVETDRFGRFSARVSEAPEDRIDVSVSDARGRSVQAGIKVPRLEITEPQGAKLLAYGEKGEHYRVSDAPQGGRWGPDETVMEHELVGRTNQGNVVELEKEALTVGPDGTFKTLLKLKQGSNQYGILVRDPSGYSRISTLIVNVADRNEKGRLVVAVRPIPNLSAEFSVSGMALKNQLLMITGITDKENTIRVNDQPVPVQPNGTFTQALKLPTGKNHIEVRVADPDGNVGRIERDIVVDETQFFFLAFADGVYGQMQGKGYLQGAGMNDSSEYYAQGRVAYYLKGVIAGKYLITSAFDTGSNDYNKMFKNLDSAQQDRLLTNIDPDKFYPVYGDSGSVVYDVQNQGKFYLAVDSDDFHLLVGDYPISLSDTELATYKATLYGAKASYQSVSRTKYGKPDTEIIIFGAEVFQTHVRDEVSATGGSLYYLSHKDVTEGSEQVSLVVRDKNTGLLVSRIPQQQNVDYTIKYEEGRILFNRPLSSTAPDATLINQQVQPGNPVSIQVDYEIKVDSLQKTAGGGRVRQQLGDHVSLGSTYVKDELGIGAYELKGVDTEVRLGKNTRVLGEYAESSGTDASSYISTDGGLTYTEVTPHGFQEGKAWKASAEVDVGELLGGAPDRYQVGGYVKKLQDGFLSNGNFNEKGTEKSGVDTKVQFTQNDKILARYDRQEVDTLDAGAAQKTDTGTVQYSHKKDWWEVAAEYQTFKSFDPTGTALNDASLGAVRLTVTPRDPFTLYVQRQESISGPENDQTTLGVKYRILPTLSLVVSGTTGTTGHSAQAGLVLQDGKSNLYVTERLTDDNAVQTTSTIFGTQYQFAPLSKVYSEYQWEHSDAEQGPRTVSLVGAQRQWDLTKGVTFLLAAEEADQHAATGDTSRYSVAAGLSILSSSGVKFSTRDELRHETGKQSLAQYLTVNQLDIKVNPDYTFIGKYRYSVTHDLMHDTIQAKFDERSIGLAYRPVANDRFNALAKYTLLLDEHPLSPAVTDLTTALSRVTSLEWSLQLNPTIEWVEKFAYKIKTEESETMPTATTHTWLVINRLNFTIWKMIDLGTEYRILTQREADDQLEGWLVELMWRASKYIRLGVGYNFTSFSDNEFSDNNYSVRGWFLRLQGKY
jgi:uncharacterized repeat protein (TIGR01451 family)